MSFNENFQRSDKRTLSKMSVASNTKPSIKKKMTNILNSMNTEYPLFFLAEKLEYETGGKFTELTLREIIDKYYQDLPEADKIYLLKHLPKPKIGVTTDSQLISLLNLFKYFEKLTGDKIVSPCLVFYKVAERLKYKFNQPTSIFIESIGLKADGEITMDDFYTSLATKLQLDELTSIVLFKAIDYNQSGIIKIENLILVIDSFRENFFVNDNNNNDNSKLLKKFLKENFISLEQIYEKAEYNYLSFIDLKSILNKEIYKNKKFFGDNRNNSNGQEINENIIESVLSVIKRDDKIFKEDLDNYLLLSKDNNLNNEPNDNIMLKLNYRQKYWINKYIDILSLAQVTPKMAFNAAAKEPNSNVIKIADLLRQLVKYVPGGTINDEELKSLMDALDINTTGLIEQNQFNIMINSIINEKQKIAESFNKNDEQFDLRNKMNIWSSGIKSKIYHLLPVKGNYSILEQISKDILQNLLSEEKNGGGFKKAGRTKSNKNVFFEEIMKGDQGAAVSEEVDSNTGRIVAYYTNEKKNSANNEDQSDEYLVKRGIENLKISNFYLPSYDLFNELYINQKLSKKCSNDVVKYIDNNDDGFISIIDLINFLLKELKYRSTILVYKYLYIKIYKELKLATSISFFEKHSIDVQKKINSKKLCKLFSKIYIEIPLTIKLCDDLQNIFKPPFTYLNICQIIDQYQTDPYLNGFSPFQKEEESKIVSFDKKNLDNEMKKKVRELIDMKNYNGNDYLRCENLHENLNTILSKCNEEMNLSQYNTNFASKIKLDSSLALTIFQLLRQRDKNNQQIIKKSDLLMFFESYCCESEPSNSNNNCNNEQKKMKKSTKIQNIVETIENHGPPMKYSFETIPFRSNGFVSCSELFKYLDKFYNHSIPRTDIMTIITNIDENKTGIIDYQQLQLFLYNFSNKISYAIELQIIACKLFSKNISSSKNYFKKKFKKTISNFEEITEKQHKKILSNLCCNNNTTSELFSYFTNLSNNSNYYDIKYLTDPIDAYLESDNSTNNPNNITLNTEEDENNDSSTKNELPDKSSIEDVLKHFNLGPDGSVSMSELFIGMDKRQRINILKKIDSDKKGFIEFPIFIQKCRKIYGVTIDLNYKLCAQYLYKVFIKSPNKITEFILNKAQCKDINDYISYKSLYEKFMFAFCNDKYLFELFYMVYKEKKGNKVNDICLKSILLFIENNNPELKSLRNNQEAITNYKNKNYNKTEINANDDPRIRISNLLEKKLTNVREIIDKINVDIAKLQKNFSVLENYIDTLLRAQFNFNEEESDEICSAFRLEDGKFNLKKFFTFDQSNIKMRNIIIEDDVLPKIQNQINTSNYKSYKEYKSRIFNVDFLDISELYSKFHLLYKTTLFQCLLIINGSQYLSIEKFFTEFNLKNYFPCKDFEPSLKLALIRLNEYFEKHKDKLKVFKKFDLDNNGILSPDEFITALNSMKDLDLNDNQKYRLLNVADTNKDGTINAKEFLVFVKSIKTYTNENGEINSVMPSFRENKDKAKNNNGENFVSKILDTSSIGQIKTNLKINRNKFRENNDNEFLSYIIKLQENIIENFYSYQCMEKDFNIADSSKNGVISISAFKIILQKRLFGISDDILQKMVDLSNKKEEGNSNYDDNEDNENNDDNNKINYKRFLVNLTKYKEEKEEEDRIISGRYSKKHLPKIN